ncbi:MAG: response regulator transcription factor [Burkholderiales bacterium]|jgi:DNA-binding NarL/FixJ family response regulator|uniref:response regulator transcription factor n=1 Tax=Limnobacter sp. TaxID=2003368 RepID=UPI0039BD0BE8|nr:response regulator transcription factor [Burkholderiales bacterium]
MKNQKILVLEDHPLISMVIEDVCKDMAPHAQIHVVTSLAQAREHVFDKPELIIFDLTLMDSAGQNTIDWLDSMFPKVCALIYTGFVNETVSARALQSGYSVVEKTCSQSALAHEIEAVLFKSGILNGNSSDSVPANEYQSGIVAYPGAKPLTWRQVEIMRMTAEGLSAKMVAQRMGLSPETVRGHIREIFKRLEVSNKAQAVNVFLKAERSVKMKLND